MNAPLHREMPAGTLDAERALSDVSAQWDGDIVRQLTDYIAIPAKSPGFDKDWSANGYLETVLRNAAAWVEAQKVEGLKLEIVRLEGRTPVLVEEVQGRTYQDDIAARGSSVAGELARTLGLGLISFARPKSFRARLSRWRWYRRPYAVALALVRVRAESPPAHRGR